MSKIEWTERTWNPIVGCSVVSPGCTNCYAMKQAARIERMSPDLAHYKGLTQASKAGPVWTGKVALSEHALLEPLRRKRPTTYFVNSMSDLFHEDVPDEWIDRVFAVMALAPQHTFQVLTKRAKRMREYMNARRSRVVWEEACDLAIETDADVLLCGPMGDPPFGLPGRRVEVGTWPLPNVWLGVSAEDQTRADERVPELLATPAAVRFVSAEPLLGPIDFRRWLATAKVVCKKCSEPFWLHEAEPCQHGDNGWTLACPHCGDCRCTPKQDDRGDPVTWGPPTDWTPKNVGRFDRVHPTIDVNSGLDWIIVGGESGPAARPMHPDWPRAIRDACAAAGVPFFFKQWGEWHTAAYRMSDGQPVFRQFTTFQHWVDKASTWVRGGICLDALGRKLNIGADFQRARDENAFPVTIMHRIGKARAGRLLDGRTHDDTPAKLANAPVCKEVA